MKQFDIFGAPKPAEPEKYTPKVSVPVYEPRGKPPHVIELRDMMKTNRLINEIEASGVSDLEKQFLISAAHRHTVFFYKRIADYYAHASAEMQRLMERSALVIIDFDDAIKLGYVKLSQESTQQYLEEQADEI